MNINLHLHIHACIYIYAYTGIYIYIRILFTYIYIHTVISINIRIMIQSWNSGIKKKSMIVATKFREKRFKQASFAIFMQLDDTISIAADLAVLKMSCHCNIHYVWMYEIAFWNWMARWWNHISNWWFQIHRFAESIFYFPNWKSPRIVGRLIPKWSIYMWPKWVNGHTGHT